MTTTVDSDSGGGAGFAPAICSKVFGSAAMGGYPETTNTGNAPGVRANFKPSIDATKLAA
jgi:hypothetical protein